MTMILKKKKKYWNAAKKGCHGKTQNNTHDGPKLTTENEKRN